MAKLQPHHYNAATSHTDIVAAVRALWTDVESLHCELPETPTKQCSLLHEEEEAAWAALADDLPSSPESTSRIYTLTKGIHRPATVMTGSHNKHNAHTTLHLTAHWLIPISKAYAWWYATQSTNAVRHHDQTLLSSEQPLPVWHSQVPEQQSRLWDLIKLAPQSNPTDTKVLGDSQKQRRV